MHSYWHPTEKKQINRYNIKYIIDTTDDVPCPCLNLYYNPAVFNRQLYYIKFSVATSFVCFVLKFVLIILNSSYHIGLIKSVKRLLSCAMS